MTKLPKKSTDCLESVQLPLREDQEDISAFEQRACETTISYEELLEDSKSHGKL